MKLDLFVFTSHLTIYVTILERNSLHRIVFWHPVVVLDLVLLPCQLHPALQHTQRARLFCLIYEPSKSTLRRRIEIRFAIVLYSSFHYFFFSLTFPWPLLPIFLISLLFLFWNDHVKSVASKISKVAFIFDTKKEISAQFESTIFSFVFTLCT